MRDINETVRMKCYEPVPRNKDGMRWIRHRFPIKGGISMRDVWAQMYKQNPLLKRIMERNRAQP